MIIKRQKLRIIVKYWKLFAEYNTTESVLRGYMLKHLKSKRTFKKNIYLWKSSKLPKFQNFIDP